MDYQTLNEVCGNVAFGLSVFIGGIASESAIVKRVTGRVSRYLNDIYFQALVLDASRERLADTPSKLETTQ
ncbi:MAG: hypothetical protein AABX17_04200 [Nanoarchaeota archaeon]